MDLQAKLKHYRISPQEYERISSLLNRPPQGIEWALFSALWSEHCSYKSSKVHLKNLYRKSERVLEAEGENAGVVDLGQGERIAFKMESHNHPSFIEPYQGAATGVGGILRDIFTMGARPIALADYLCFGSPRADRMNRLLDGVVRGIGGYGNCVGVPTVTGFTEFNASYDKNILVNAMAVGYLGSEDVVALSKARGPGNLVVYVGAKTGKDGVHGASMASESFDQDSESKKPNVQIGDPFLEKLLIEACIEVIQRKLVVAIQDMGAAGLTSSSFEMAAKGGVGLRMHLDQVPLRDSSMSPEEILLSESQERMLLVCEEYKLEELKSVFERWGLDAQVIGSVTSSPEVEILWRDETLAKLDPTLLTDQAPQYARAFKAWSSVRKVQEFIEAPPFADLKTHLESLVSSSFGTSREFIYQQYDQRVGAKTAFDASRSLAILQLPETHRGLAIAVGCRPWVMRMDAQMGGHDAVAFPALQMCVKGAEPLAVTDCLNFGNPEKVEIMTEFVASLRALSDAAEAFRSPIVSGNVSFYNETLGENITSTPATGLIGLRNDVEALPADTFTALRQSLFLLRLPQVETTGVTAELQNQKPVFKGQLQVHQVALFGQMLRELANAQQVQASRLVGSGGLLYTLFKMSKRGIGCKLNSTLKSFYPTSQALLREHFYEVVFVVKDDDRQKFLETFGSLQEKLSLREVEMGHIGETHLDQLVIPEWLHIELKDVIERYQRGLGGIFEGLA